VITQVLLNESGSTGVYFDEEGQPMQASILARDPMFAAKIAAETRSLLATVPA
jgi:hypothetical protein